MTRRRGSRCSGASPTFSPDGRTLALASLETTYAVRLHDAANGKELRHWPTPKQHRREWGRFFPRWPFFGGQQWIGDPSDPVELQRVRGVEVLEYLATPEARQLLLTLARGAPQARLTQEAKASLRRLTSQPVGGP